MSTIRAKGVKADSREEQKKKAELLAASKAKHLTPELLVELKSINNGLKSKTDSVRLSATHRLHTIGDSKGWSLLEIWGTIAEIDDLSSTKR
jgi:hypothetical protein